jgi:hypothetical protein
MIGGNALYKLSPAGARIEGTCIQNHIGPYQEVMASVILLLRHNPKLFDYWRAQDGNAYGA